MSNNIGNYAKHAKFWQWGGNDGTVEYEYWYNYASKYGNNVLIPMCALGETGAYMAQKGMNVIAFDITDEMINEGKRLFADISGLQLFKCDIRDFRLDIPQMDFSYCTDFGHLHSIEDITKALTCINNHLRIGGCLVIETGVRLTNAKSNYTPTQTWHPFKQVYPGLNVWKTGDTRNDAETGRCYISQTFYAEDESGNIDSFDHEFYLQSYYREEWLAAFEECGFDVLGEYSNRELRSWQSNSDGYRIFEITKRGD